MGLDMFARKPQWILNYSGINITSDISSSVLSVTYADYLEGLSGAVEVAVADGQRLWQGAWLPALGDQVNVMLGYADEPMLSCGDFQVDEVELSGDEEAGGDVVTMRGLAAYITAGMRTANSAGYENRSLLQIAGTVAEKYGMRVVCASDLDDPGFARVTQSGETDLAFLKRLAREHGYDFTVRGNKLVFFSHSALEDAIALVSADRRNVERFEFRNRSHQTYAAAEVSYSDPDSKGLISQSAVSPRGAPTDRLKLVARCENAQQAILKAQAALDWRNQNRTEGILHMAGSTALCAGLTLSVSDFGRFDGHYIIVAALHKLSRKNGYTTKLEIRRVS